MDSYRGHFADHAASDYIESDYDADGDDMAVQPPPMAIGTNERRMQVRAYNHWAGLLGNRSFPSIVDLQSAAIPDFAPHAVLLDFSKGIDNPGITMLGDRLAAECNTDKSIRRLSDVPGRSLLSRITDHYMQILANQTPIGFEAEFVNQLGKTILYRGILLPFSDDGRTIQHIMGVINWKEMADQQSTDALLKEIDQALADNKFSSWNQGISDEDADDDDVLELSAPLPNMSVTSEITDWADGPASLDNLAEDVLDLAEFDALDAEIPAWDDAEINELPNVVAPTPELLSPLLVKKSGQLQIALTPEGIAPQPESAPSPQPAAQTHNMGLADWLASARELALAAHGSEDRSRHALYAAIGRAHDFALASVDAPQEFQSLVDDAGLTVQDRAPFTPIVKLVFGAQYDKTRLTEYGAALAYAQRLGLGHGALADHLIQAPGGLKGVVGEERIFRRGDSGKPIAKRQNLRDSLARKLRKLPMLALDDLSPHGEEFALVLARRLPTGEIAILGEVAHDLAPLERAARQILS
ncbi:MAG: hypothetical protein RLY97_512 [Pseudomonadota bacterium]|jgi:hypothetical protein